MKVIAVFVFATLSCLRAGGQIKWSEPIEYEESEGSMESTKLPNGQSLTLIMPRSLFSNTIRASLYDPSAGKITRKKLSFPKQTAGMLFKPWLDRLIRLKDKYYFLLRSYDKSRGVRTLLAWSFDREMLTISERPVELMAVPDVKVAGEILYRLDSDGGKLYILGKHGGKLGDTGTETERWTITNYDWNLQKFFEKDYDLDYQRVNLSIDEFSVLDDEGLFVICKYSAEPGTFAHPSEKTVVFFSISKDSSKPVETKLNVRGVLKANYIYESGNFFVYGLVSSTNTAESPTGIFATHFDRAGKILMDPIERRFPQQTINHTEPPRYGTGIGNLQLYNVFKRSDGGYQFVAEQTVDVPFPTQSHYTNYRTTGGVTYRETIDVTVNPNWTANDVVVFSIFPDSTKDWFTVLRKVRYAGSPFEKQFISFAQVYDGADNLHLIYNDDLNNLTHGEGETPKYNMFKPKAVTMHAVISSGGKLTKKALFAPEVGVKVSVPSFSFKDDGSFTFVGCGKKTYMIGTGRLEE